MSEAKAEMTEAVPSNTTPLENQAATTTSVEGTAPIANLDNAKQEEQPEAKQVQKNTGEQIDPVEEEAHVKADAKHDSLSQKQHREEGRPNKKRRVAADSQNKFDPSFLEESNDPDEIRKQVEFYFSDANLPTDKFLFTQVGGSENKAIPIKVVHSFKRMRHFQPYSAVVEALKESTFLEVTENEGIRRQVPLDSSIGKSSVDNVKIVEDKAQPRSIYAKGFGKEDPSTQFDIEAFFMPYGPINAVRLRRHAHDQKFKGSVFVEFDSAKTQEAFLALEPKPKWNGETLLIMSKKDYVEKKAQDIRDGKIQPNAHRQGYHNSGHGRGRGRGTRQFGGRDRREGGQNGGRDRDRDDWKGRRDDFQKNGFSDKQSKDKGKGGEMDDERMSAAVDTAPKKRYDERGIPIVETGSYASDNTTNGSGGKIKQEVQAESKKRGRQETGAEDETRDNKKAKTSEEPLVS